MDLHIEHPQAEALARELAERRNTTVDEAVVFALKAELKRNEMQVRSLVQLRSPEEQARVRAALRAIQAEALALSEPGGRDLTKDEIDTLWGHE